MEKDYYTYAEILFGLRKEYIKNMRILKKLKDCISITNENMDSFLLNVIPKNNNLDSRLRLVVLKKQSFLLKLIKNNNYYNQSCTYNNIYELTKKDFLNNNNLESKYVIQNFNPEIQITNNNDFNILLNKLFELSLLKESLDINLNDNLNLLINEEIALINGIKSYNEKAHVIYKPLFDKIEFDIHEKRTNLYAYKMLQTKILKKEIPLYYQEIINENINDKKIYLGNILKKDKEQLSIKEYNNEYVLKK